MKSLKIVKTKKVLTADELFFSQFAMEKIRDAIFVLNKNARIIYINEAACKWTGYTKKELLSMSMFKIDPNLTPKNWLEHWEKKKKLGSLQFATQFKTKDKKTFLVEVSSNYFRYQGKECNFAIARNMEERKKTEKALLKSRKKYQDFINFLPQTVFEADTNGRLIFVNQQAFKLFGYTKEDIKKIKSVANLVIPEQRIIAKNNLEAIIEGKPNKVKAHEYLFIKKNGETFPGIAYTDRVIENGKVIGVKGILIDSTEQKKEKELLKNEKARLNLFLDSAPFGIVITDKNHRLFYANPQFNEMLGYSTEEVADRDDWFRKLYPQKKYRNIISKLWDESISNNKVRHKTTPRILTVRCKNRKNKYVRFIHVRLATQEVLITLEDFTERKVAEKRLIESYKHLGVINRQVSILSKLKREESDETIEEKMEEILVSANELFQAEASLLYKCDCNIKDCSLFSKAGLTKNQTVSIRNFSFCNSRIEKELKKGSKQIYGSLKEYGLDKVAGLSEMKYFLFLPIMKENKVIAFTLTFFKKNTEIVNQDLFVEIFSLKANSILRGLGVI